MSNLPLIGPNKPNDVKVADYVKGLYDKSFPVSGDEYDAVRAFFLRRTNGDKTAAEALTASILTIAYNRNIRPLAIIDEFKNYTDNVTFTAALIGLINSERRNTSRLGFATTPNQDQYVVRNITP